MSEMNSVSTDLKPTHPNGQLSYTYRNSLPLQFYTDCIIIVLWILEMEIMMMRVLPLGDANE